MRNKRLWKNLILATAYAVAFGMVSVPVLAAGANEEVQALEVAEKDYVKGELTGYEFAGASDGVITVTDDNITSSGSFYTTLKVNISIENAQNSSGVFSIDANENLDEYAFLLDGYTLDVFDFTLEVPNAREQLIKAGGTKTFSGTFVLGIEQEGVQTELDTMDYSFTLKYVSGEKIVGWKEIFGEWYYFNENGIMETGWIAVDGHWYYMNQWGVMQTGWVVVDGHWYYLDQWGAMTTGWTEVNEHWYYMDQWGAMMTGWVSVGGYWYYMDQWGAMMTGWVAVDDYWYYMDQWGAMRTGWILLGDNWYYLNGDGTMATEWVFVDGSWYYLSSRGMMSTGWFFDGHWYYLNSSGAMQTGWIYINSHWRYLNSDGSMAASQWIGDYYVQADGSMATDTWIDGYYVDASGKWVKSV